MGVHVQVGRCQPDAHTEQSQHGKAATLTGCGKFTLVHGHQRAPRQVWFIPGIFPGSLNGSAAVRQCACAAQLSQSFQLNALRLLCSSGFLSVLVWWRAGGLVHFSAVDLGTEFKKNPSVSGMRWGVDLGGHVWLPGFLSYGGLVNYLLRLSNVLCSDYSVFMDIRFPLQYVR